MSYKVAVVCEDHTLDQYIAKPIIHETLRRAGRPHARVDVVRNPRLRGYDSLRVQLCDIVLRYGAIADAVVVIVDLDCTVGPTDRGEVIRRLASTCSEFGTKVLVVGAVQEIEVWALWGARTRLRASWEEVRSDCNPKERFFQPLQTAIDKKRPDKGRTRLMAASLDQGWESLTAGCPELAQLVTDLRSFTNTSSGDEA